MAVPDAKVIDMEVNGYANPFYQRMSSSASSSILSDAIAKNPKTPKPLDCYEDI
jgi:hypothetical protein